MIRKYIKNAAFKYLTKKQESHSKINIIKYSKLETQKYMISPIFSNEEVNQLHALRAKTTNCKMNFKNRFKIEDLLCNLCESEDQDQEHLLQCSVVIRKLKSSHVTKQKIEYEDIYSDNVNKQKEVTSLFVEIFNIKNKLETEENSQLAPSTMDMVLVRDDNLPCGIVHPSSGK